MTPSGIVTLTTDFGTGSSYVGELKGSLLRDAPHANVVDLFHDVAPQNVAEGAVRLEPCFAFPPGTVHIAVVDPGVGAGRAVLFARVCEQAFIAPDNGLLSWVAPPDRIEELRRIENRALFRTTRSRTFEGRDVMAPVAAALLRGLSPEELGPLTDEMVRIALPEPLREADELHGSVLFVDAYGNAVTDIRRSHVEPGCVAIGKAGDVVCRRMVETYSQAPAGELVMLFGSSDRLEFAVVNGSAGATWRLHAGSPVRIKLAPASPSDAGVS